MDDEKETTTKVSPKKLAEMLTSVADNYAPGVTVKAVHFNKSRADIHVVLETDLGYGETHQEYIDVRRDYTRREK